MATNPKPAPELIYCANGNRRFAQIAIDHGFAYGAQLPGTVYFPPAFVDQNWKSPDRVKYMAALAQHRPYMASVLDWERRDQLSEVLSWAEEAAAFAEVVMIIPEVPRHVHLIPKAIGNKPVRLGFSIPTRHGGTACHPVEFMDYPVHLLGGSPHAQMKWFSLIPRVVSVDGNMHHKLATRYGAFWSAVSFPGRGHWPSVAEYDGQRWGDGSNTADAPYEAFRRSCVNIMRAWDDSLQR